MRSLRVFVVEDNAIEAGGFCAMLEDMEHCVVGTALDGEEAVRKISERTDELDIVLMDVNLPKQDGISSAKKLNELCKVPIIIVTGYSPEKMLNTEGLENVYGYIQKPVGAYELGACIKIVYDRYSENQSIRHALTGKTQELAERKIIERAKGIVMRMNGLTEAQAMARLQKKSRDTNTKLIKIAKEIVEASNNLKF